MSVLRFTSMERDTHYPTLYFPVPGISVSFFPGLETSGSGVSCPMVELVPGCAMSGWVVGTDHCPSLYETRAVRQNASEMRRGFLNVAKLRRVLAGWLSPRSNSSVGTLSYAAIDELRGRLRRRLARLARRVISLVSQHVVAYSFSTRRDFRDKIRSLIGRYRDVFVYFQKRSRVVRPRLSTAQAFGICASKYSHS